MVVCSRMSEERFLNFFEIGGLLRSAQNVNTQKATSLWLDAVTSFRQEKNLDISFRTCSKTELDQFLCKFYTSLRPKKPGVAVQPQLLFNFGECSHSTTRSHFTAAVKPLLRRRVQAIHWCSERHSCSENEGRQLPPGTAQGATQHGRFNDPGRVL